MPVTAHSRPVSVSLIAVPEVSAAIVYGLHDVFTCVGMVWEALTGQPAAGLLDGSDATTHWSAQPTFQRCYPKVLLRPERLLVPAGIEHRIVTSGGSNSWTELALYLIARFCGDAEARRIAKVFLFGDRSDGQLPFAAMLRPRQHDDAIIGETQTWIAEH